MRSHRNAGSSQGNSRDSPPDYPSVSFLPNLVVPRANGLSINVGIESGIVAMFGGGRLEDQALAMLRGQLADIVFGAVFLFIGLAACSDRRHPSAERRTPRSLVRNMERDVRNRTPGSVAGCRCGSAPRASDERPLREHLIAYLLAVFAMSTFWS